MRQSLVQALKPRAQSIAEVIASRLENAGLWNDYKKEEELDGELNEFPDGSYFITYTRKSTPEFPRATMRFAGIQLTDTIGLKIGDPVILHKDVIERYEDSIEIGKDGVDYQEEISHTFSKTTTLDQAVKVGAELAVKTSAGVDMEGVKAGVEVSAKITAEYNRQWGSSETQSDTVTRKIDVQGKNKIDYVAERSKDVEQREIVANSGITHDILLIDERDQNGGNSTDGQRLINKDWSSVEEFIEVVEALAPSNKTMYKEFINNPIVIEDKYPDITNKPETVRYMVTYDNVTREDITIL